MSDQELPPPSGNDRDLASGMKDIVWELGWKSMAVGSVFGLAVWGGVYAWKHRHNLRTDVKRDLSDAFNTIKDKAGLFPPPEPKPPRP